MKHAFTGKITPATSEEPRADRSDLARVQALRDEDIALDADNPRTTDVDWEGASMRQGGVLLGHTPRRRGAGKRPAREAVQLRLMPDTLARWRATGPGWQTRMAEALDKALPA